MKRFSEYIDDLNKKTLYVHRPLLNGEEVVKWAKANGCTTCLKPDKMHVTLCYSKTPLHWPAPMNDVVTVRDFVSEVQQFDGGATVLHFHWLPFKGRNNQLLKAGATSDFPDYKSHITLTYEGAGLDPKSFSQYEGTLVFGPEIFREVDLDKKWKNETLEEAAYWHKDVNAWGIIKADGPISGNASKYASSHEELGNRERDYGDYYKDKASNTLHIRTHNKESLNWAVQHFNKLPHGKTGDVYHEHYDHSGCGDHGALECEHKVTHNHEGKRHSVLPKMQALADSMK